MTTSLTDTQRVTALKHLAGGKSLDIVATILHTTREEISELARKHGYPDEKKLAWAADILEKKLDEESAIPDHPDPGSVTRTQPAAATQTPPAGASTPPAGGSTVLTKPDEIRVLINTGKGHPSKRIQAAADRVIDAVDRLKTLIAEDQEKNAEKRRLAAEKEQARAEVARLEEQLRKAKEKLRGDRAPAKTTETAPSDGPTAAEIRAWAADNDVECPSHGRVPGHVREAYDAAHQGDAA